MRKRDEAWQFPEISGYRRVKRLGGGGYGEVWLVRHEQTGVFRAAKFIFRDRFEYVEDF